MTNRPVNAMATNDISEMIDLERDRRRPYKPDEVEDSPFIDARKTAQRLDPGKQADKKGTKPPTWKQNLSYYFSQYCSSTSIHGIQYLGERGRFVIEKIVWTFIVATVCYLCIYLIVKAYHKWVTQPVIVTFATRETSIWKIPFPAVTICPEVKSDPEIFNYTDVWLRKVTGLNVTQEEDGYLETFALICNNELFEDFDYGFRNLTDGDHILSNLNETVPNPDPYNVTSIRWLGNKYEMDDLLSTSITKEGLCYSFNMFHYEEILKFPEEYLTDKSLDGTRARKWSLEDGYPNDDEQDSFPRRTFLSGISSGFIFEALFANHSHLDHICTDFLQGFKVTLHHPSELPNMDKHFRVPLDQAVLVAIKPRMITASDELKSYKPEVRECYFADERPLAYFRSYTQQNCLDECLSNYTLSECKCVPFYLPGFDDMPSCGPGSSDCFERSKVKYLSGKGNNCNCLPFCTGLNYDVEITQTEWNWRELFQNFRRLGVDDTLIPKDFEKSHFSKLVVFFKEQQFLASERHELYGYVDFFSNVGGLLGLFIGFSVTSFIEILYFLTLRLGCNFKKFGRTFWSGEPALINAENQGN